MEKKRILVVGMIGLLLAAGLVVAGCETEGGECIGNGECTITIKQGSSGLYVDGDSPKSSCGYTKYNDKGELVGCQVEKMDNYYWQNEYMRYGTHGCNCDKLQ